MTDFPRYAIYYVPSAAAPLARFGAELLGYDAFTGRDVAFPAAVVAPFPDWPAWTGDPRKYGFHGTLKAPFALAPEQDEAALIAACNGFAASRRAIPAITPVVQAISGFIAVVPAVPGAELNALAQDCVEAFDRFRAPMTPADRARRKPEALTSRQRDQLDRFGYPFVRDDFRFHLTLTGRLPRDRSAAVLSMLQARFAAMELTMLLIDRLAVFRQDSASARFRIVHEVALT
jgi:putative phosphonate metabolism protein